MRDLHAGPRPARVTYRVTTLTSDLRGAGTDANVSVQLHGRRGDGRRLELAAGPQDFERWAQPASQLAQLLCIVLHPLGPDCCIAQHWHSGCGHRRAVLCDRVLQGRPQ